MKKFLFSLVVFSSLAFVASAQKSTVSLGPSAGFGHTWISGFDNSKYKPAGNAGISLIYSGQTNFGVGVDVKYSFEGGERDVKVPVLTQSYTVNEDVSLNYIRVPIKAIYFFGKYGQRVRPKLAVGPSFGFLVGGKTETTTTNAAGSVTGESTADSKDAWNNFDFGITGSAGLNYRLVNRTWLAIDIAYLHGITDARKDGNSHSVANFYDANNNYHNKNIQLNVGVNFGL